ncbi:hypothetical protein [Anaerobiospirillum succiniciproducens]|uniref:hypothetical protein n=1 Tax=Anaerobiospirillum succiniciproducens TaxID=13335 RepID=UPI00248DCB9C|nr:hypothetical protein [Anaerobiospirillum succiniciproducens]
MINSKQHQCILSRSKLALALTAACSTILLNACNLNDFANSLREFGGVQIDSHELELKKQYLYSKYVCLDFVPALSHYYALNRTTFAVYADDKATDELKQHYEALADVMQQHGAAVCRSKASCKARATVVNSSLIKSQDDGIYMVNVNTNKLKLSRLYTTQGESLGPMSVLSHKKALYRSKLTEPNQYRSAQDFEAQAQEQLLNAYRAQTIEQTQDLFIDENAQATANITGAIAAAATSTSTATKASKSAKLKASNKSRSANKTKSKAIARATTNSASPAAYASTSASDASSKASANANAIASSNTKSEGTSLAQVNDVSAASKHGESAGASKRSESLLPSLDMMSAKLRVNQNVEGSSLTGTLLSESISTKGAVEVKASVADETKARMSAPDSSLSAQDNGVKSDDRKAPIGANWLSRLLGISSANAMGLGEAMDLAKDTVRQKSELENTSTGQLASKQDPIPIPEPLKEVSIKPQKVSNTNPLEGFVRDIQYKNLYGNSVIWKFHPELQEAKRIELEQMLALDAAKTNPDLFRADIDYLNYMCIKVHPQEQQDALHDVSPIAHTKDKYWIKERLDAKGFNFDEHQVYFAHDGTIRTKYTKDEEEIFSRQFAAAIHEAKKRTVPDAYPWEVTDSDEVTFAKVTAMVNEGKTLDLTLKPLTDLSDFASSKYLTKYLAPYEEQLMKNDYKNLMIFKYVQPHEDHSAPHYDCPAAYYGHFALSKYLSKDVMNYLTKSYAQHLTAKHNDAAYKHPMLNA